MIHVVQGFKLSTRDAVDARLVLTKADMKSINDNQMPDKYFAVCKDDGCLYLYDKFHTDPSSDTGKFFKFNDSKIDYISINGTPLPIDNRHVDLPTATAERCGLIITGKGLKAVEGGVVSLDFTSIDDKSIPFEKLNLEDVVIDASNIHIN